MKKKNSVILSIVLILLLGVFSLNFLNVKADSGWDSSYDSWDSGSDWSSSSSWDNDYSSSSSYGSSNNEGSVAIFLIFIAIIVIICIVNGKKGKKELQNNTKIVDVTIPGFNKEEFLKMTYDNFVKVQNAWSDFDYDELRKLLSNELYNTYKYQLNELKIKKQKNVMHDFELISNNITAFSESEKEYSITTELCVKFYDYVVDQNNKVLRGNDKRRLVMTYSLTFIKSKDTKSNKCANCNATLDNVVSSVCPYCKSTIIAPTHDFILSKKSAKNQTFE